MVKKIARPNKCIGMRLKNKNLRRKTSHVFNPMQKRWTNLNLLCT
jgi:hypothetical protein